MLSLRISSMLLLFVGYPNGERLPGRASSSVFSITRQKRRRKIGLRRIHNVL